MIVIDASAALEVLLRSAAGLRAEQQMLAPGESLHAPHLIDVEVAQVLRRYARAGQLTDARCAEALTDWGAFRVHRYAHDWMLDRMWVLRANVTAYDATYLALAEALDAPLLTCDARLAAAPGHTTTIQLL